MSFAVVVLLASALVAAPVEAPAEAPSAEAPAEPEPAKPAFETFTDDPLAVRRVVLANGLTVMLSENHERPEIFGAVVVRTGGRNDPPNDTGMAHYLEHMLFKGTTKIGTTDWERERPLQEKLVTLYDELKRANGPKRKEIETEIRRTVAQTYAFAVPNEIDQLLEDIGSTHVNAFTTYDETVYHNTFPASQIETWLAIYAERFEEPVFRLFPTELEAVYEEKNTAIDTTGYELFRAFMRGAFPGHPYGTNDILGEVEHLKRPSLRAMREYYERWYVPGNMALVLSGDFRSEDVLPLVERHFGAWKAGPDPKPEARPVAPFEADQRLRARVTPVRAGAIAYRTVPESHADFAALQVARRLLSNEQRSGFVDRLGDQGKFLYVQHVPADLAEHNLDVVAYVPRLITQTFSGAEKLVVAQFRRVRDGGFSDRQFQALKDGLILEETEKWEDNRERALAMTHAFVAKGGWEGHLRYLAKLKALTKADVVRVAGELFGERKLVLRSRVGYPKKTRLAKPKHPPVKGRGGAHSQRFAELRAAPKPDPKLDFVEFTTDVATAKVDERTVLRANTNPFDDLYQLELRFGVGTDKIRELDMLEDYLGRIGSTKTKGTHMRERFFELSTTITADAEIDRFVVKLAGPQRHMEAALDLLAELMTAPAAERKPLRQVRREIWAFRRLDRKNPPAVGKALRDHVLYHHDSRYHRELGPRGARLVGPKKLLDAWDEVQGHTVEVGYVGRRPPAEIATAVRDSLPLRAEVHAAVPHLVYGRRPPRETTVYFVPQRGAVQTQLWLAVEGVPVVRADRPEADAFESYFGGGMAGLVFQEVREFRALAYSAHAWYERDEEPIQRGQLVAHVGCQADKTMEALDVMVGLFTKPPAHPDRIELVRGALVRGTETDSPSFRDLQDRIDEWIFEGDRTDPRREALPAYRRLEFDDIMAFHRAHVAGKPIAIMVAGDPRKVKTKDLKRYGKVVRLREWQLYSQ